MKTRPLSKESVAEARALYDAALFHDAAALLTASQERAPEASAAILLARVELRRGNTARALAILSTARARSRAHRAEVDMLKGVAFGRLGDRQSSKACLRNAAALLGDDEALHAELHYHRAALLWIDRRLEAAASALAKVKTQRGDDLDLQVQIIRGAIASANEELDEQGFIVLDALERIRSRSKPPAYLHAMIVSQVAALAVELPRVDLRDAALRELERVQWTRDISDLHFHTKRAIAWRHALDGDEFSAFRRLKEAVAITASPAWRVAALADRASLATAFREERWAAQELRDAHELAASIDWAAVEGEEKLALPVLAELFSAREPATAMHYAATFKSSKTFSPILSSNSDRRVEALECYALGTVQLELGEAAEAKRLLKRAWKIYSELGISWRAARAAIALAKLPDETAWLAKAKEALAPYPRCWLQKDLGGGGNEIVSPELDALTPSQRVVFDLIMNGMSTSEIASQLDRSEFTIRNHVKVILKQFAVPSRSALIVKASGYKRSH
jgi:DNA-binding NarL/FixJ family response regulator